MIEYCGQQKPNTFCEKPKKKQAMLMIECTDRTGETLTVRLGPAGDVDVDVG